MGRVFESFWCKHTGTRVRTETMSTLFLIICGLAVVFYVVFLIECLWI